MTLRTNKRFYDKVAVGREGGAFTVLLGGRPLRSPQGVLLRLQTAALAAGIVNEWGAQGETIRPETMPLTRLAATAMERIGPRRRAIVDAIVGYAGTDLLCYRADAPEELVVLQDRMWQPLLDWVAGRWGARLMVATGVLPVEQPQELDRGAAARRRSDERCPADRPIFHGAVERVDRHRPGCSRCPHGRRDGVRDGDARRTLSSRTMGDRRRGGASPAGYRRRHPCRRILPGAGTSIAAQGDQCGQ